MKILHVTTIPMSLTFLRGQVGYMRERGFDVRAVSSPGEDLDAFEREEAIPVYAVPMVRQITPLRDVRAVMRLARVIRRERPEIAAARAKEREAQEKAAKENEQK